MRVPGRVQRSPGRLRGAWGRFRGVGGGSRELWEDQGSPRESSETKVIENRADMQMGVG